MSVNKNTLQTSASYFCQGNDESAKSFDHKIKGTSISMYNDLSCRKGVWGRFTVILAACSGSMTVLLRLVWVNWVSHLNHYHFIINELNIKTKY